MNKRGFEIFLVLSMICMFISAVYYYNINLGVNRCGSVCTLDWPKWWQMHILILPALALFFHFLGRYMEKMHASILLKASSVMIIGIVVFIGAWAMFISTDTQNCANVCRETIVPHPISIIAYALANIFLFFVMYELANVTHKIRHHHIKK